MSNLPLCSQCGNLSRGIQFFSHESRFTAEVAQRFCKQTVIDSHFIFLQELHEKRVTLIEGTALSERDLVRARAESTGAILLLADRFSADAKQEDLSVQFQVYISI